MAVRQRFKVIRLVSMRETPENVEITLETTEGNQVLTFTDPNRERTIALIQELSQIHRRRPGASGRRAKAEAGAGQERSFASVGSYA